MRIAIIGPAHPLRGGGISTFNERMAQVLQELGHEVTIWSFSLQYPSFLFPGKNQFTDEPAPEGLRIVSRINSINPLNWLFAGNQIKKEKPDLVLVRYWLPFMGPSLGSVLRRIKSNRHSKVICIADNIIPHEKRPGDRQFTAYFMKPVDAFVTMSREVLKDLNRMTSKPAVYHPHPLYDNYGPLIPKQEARQQLRLSPGKYLLFFGFIRKYKGLDLLLEAMADERLKQADIRLIIAGEYYEGKETCETIIAERKLSDRVFTFTDFIPNEEVRDYFSAADLVVQPYRSATQSGITQIAYHFEKPMVVTDVGGLPEVVPDGKTGFVTSPEPTAIADAILNFYEQGIPDLDIHLKEEKKKYSWAAFTKSIFDLYAQVK